MEERLTDFAALLGGGDRRSIAGAEAAAEAVLREPACFASLWKLIRDHDPLLRMRAADALEKVSRTRSDLFEPHAQSLLDGSLEDGSQELRWHLFAMASRLRLAPAKAAALMTRLEDAVRTDSSRIARATALEAAADLTARHPALAGRCDALIAEALQSPLPSLAARARKIAARRQRAS